jgi:hypothetical protein
MKHSVKSVRAFIGSKNFDLSRAFYTEVGFEEVPISKNMCYFKIFDTMGFYLQDAYVKDWIDNTMIFVEVDSVDRYWNELQQLGLQNKYTGVKLTPIQYDDWGKECFLHDPCGILWHFGEFK